MNKVKILSNQKEKKHFQLSTNYENMNIFLSKDAWKKSSYQFTLPRT